MTETPRGNLFSCKVVLAKLSTDESTFRTVHRAGTPVILILSNLRTYEHTSFRCARNEGTNRSPNKVPLLSYLSKFIKVLAVNPFPQVRPARVKQLDYWT